jgi:hypothetical protein
MEDAVNQLSTEESIVESDHAIVEKQTYKLVFHQQ